MYLSVIFSVICSVHYYIGTALRVATGGTVRAEYSNDRRITPIFSQYIQ